jgi:hypothetical protein
MVDVLLPFVIDIDRRIEGTEVTSRIRVGMVVGYAV